MEVNVKKVVTNIAQCDKALTLSFVLSNMVVTIGMVYIKVAGAGLLGPTLRD